MNTQFKESFTKDLRKIRDKDLLNRAKAAIETVEQAQSLGEIPNLERLTQMERDTRNALVHLNETERDCVLQYLSLLIDQMAETLQEVWLFGSAARGDMWPDWSPMHSDIDLLLLTERPVPLELQESLVNETYPLFLKCGRQISPQFRTIAQFYVPADDKTSDFSQRVQGEGKLIYKSS